MDSSLPRSASDAPGAFKPVLVTVLVTVGRPDDPEDVAAAVLILASPAGGYLTGKILEVDGGIDRPNLDLGIPDF